MKSKLAIMVALACASSQVLAIDPQSIQTEYGFDITPFLTTGLKYDDNITSVANNEIDSWIMTVVPTIKARADDGVTIYEFTAGAFSGTYFDSSDDNFIDTNLGGLFDTRLSEQSKVNLKADLIWGHEDRGTGITEGLGNDQNEPTRYNNQTVSGFYEFGAKSTPARVRLGAQYYNKEYMNQREATRTRDYDSAQTNANFYYDTQSGTTAVLETSINDINYKLDDPIALRDSKDTNVKVGAEWQISALTSGEVKIGYQKKDFDDAAREDFSGVAWTVNANWSPLSYTRFNIGTGRKAKDPLQGGDYIKETTYVAGWTHTWSQAVQTNLSYNRMEEDYVGLVRKDTNDSYTASVKYAFRRFMDISLYSTVTDKTSSVPGIEFDRNIVGINFDFSL